ncbi:MAG: hypothetical protein KC609_09865 [Myxococcales bacterium]|nr:hypothetical protein [Myxococcales bacterium]
MTKLCCLYKHRRTGELLTLCRTDDPSALLDGADGEWRLVNQWPVNEIAECQLFRAQPELDAVFRQLVGLLRETSLPAGPTPPYDALAISGVAGPDRTDTNGALVRSEGRATVVLDDRPTPVAHSSASSRQIRILERHRQRILLFEVITKRSHLDPSITLSRLMTDWEQWTPVAASANWRVGRNATRKDGSEWRVAVRGLTARYAEFERPPREEEIESLLATLEAPPTPAETGAEGWQVADLWLDWVLWRHKETAAHRFEPFYQAQWHRQQPL